APSTATTAALSSTALIDIISILSTQPTYTIYLTPSNLNYQTPQETENQYWQNTRKHEIIKNKVHAQEANPDHFKSSYKSCRAVPTGTS
ncbi:hypothetical protein, partial [Mobiluncus mulieris]|uniref:hypothetical protein n=1 Tax=Mobiluncus mulieris TaxID=2052 RepID=UPI0021E331C5